MKRKCCKCAAFLVVGFVLFVAGIVAPGLDDDRAPAPGGVVLAAAGIGPLGATVNVGKEDNARAAIQKAIDAVQKKGGGSVLIPAGTYVLDGELVVTKDYVRLVGESRATVLQAGKGTETIIHFAASHGGVENLTLNGTMGVPLEAMIRGETGGAVRSTGVTALRIAPRPPLPKGRRVFQNYNRFSNLLITGCAEGIVMQAGPNIPKRGDSGCWYNVFDTVLIIYTWRGVWLRDPVSVSGSQVNRNQFYSVRIGQGVNTGVQIDAGDTNSFIGCSFEGIRDGESPNETPTAILINASSGTQRADNNNNTFVCARFEANRVDLDNRNPSSDFYASNVWFPKKFRGIRPLYVVGGYDPSYTPLVMPGIVYPEGNLPDMPNQINFTRPVQFHKEVTGIKSQE